MITPMTKIIKEFDVTKEQASEFLDLELDEISKIDFDFTIQSLAKFLGFYQEFYYGHFQKD